MLATPESKRQTDDFAGEFTGAAKGTRAKNRRANELAQLDRGRSSDREGEDKIGGRIERGGFEESHSGREEVQAA